VAGSVGQSPPSRRRPPIAFAYRLRDRQKTVVDGMLRRTSRAAVRRAFWRKVLPPRTARRMRPSGSSRDASTASPLLRLWRRKTRKLSGKLAHAFFGFRQALLPKLFLIVPRKNNTHKNTPPPKQRAPNSPKQANTQTPWSNHALTGGMVTNHINNPSANEKPPDKPPRGYYTAQRAEAETRCCAPLQGQAKHAQHGKKTPIGGNNNTPQQPHIGKPLTKCGIG